MQHVLNSIREVDSRLTQKLPSKGKSHQKRRTLQQLGVNREGSAT
jgi:hypothetical protein